MLPFLHMHALGLVEKTWEQFYLAMLAILLATFIGVPLGLLVAHTEKRRKIVLGLAGILQTIPSLAILAFLLPFLGIGFKPAILTLCLYAILPIIQNTVAGMRSVPDDLIEAANGLGFTKLQKLWMVELPLALPLIVSGLRIAMALSVGIVTIAAFVGAGGLGEFIYEGLATNDNKLIFLGAVPAGLLALVLDFVIARFEKFMIERRYKTFGKVKMIGTLGIFLVALFVFLVFRFYHDGQETIRVGSKNFTEQLILSEMMAQMIESKTHLKVKRKFNLGNTTVLHEAVMKGEIDLYPEYTGTANLVVLKNEVDFKKTDFFQKIKAIYHHRYQLTWLSPFGFNNTQSLVIKKSLQKKKDIRNLSDLVPFTRNLLMGIPPEGVKRLDALPGLKKYYGIQFKAIKILQPSLLYLAIKENDVDVIMGFSTDPHLLERNLIFLKDDKNIFPNYYAAPIVRNKTLKKYPALLKALSPLAGLINEKTMRYLNYQVDVQNRSVRSTVRDFLKKQKKI